MKRRDFLKTSVIAGAAVSFPHLWIKNLQAGENRFKITVLQTNDTHSRIDPFPMDGGRYQGLGGIARRATLVKQVRKENPYTLLLDAGDVLQGTPYFNLFKGKVEYETMTKCGYQVSTLGNHEFDNGVSMLADALNYAKFDIVNCNYDFGETPLSRGVKTFVTTQIGPIKVGITGVGVHFTDLVAASNHKGVAYHKPFKPLQSVINYLRKDLGCTFIIVLSHLGYKPYQGNPGDTDLAYKVNGIDWIVGGHSHTFMDQPDVVKSKKGYTTRILQVGWAGILVGKTDFVFEGEKLISVNTRMMPVNETVGEHREIRAMLG
ncbi:hypothetical protein B1H10_00210 [candidate division KSB1 bacterium 4484_188]|nr:MAG: hypothetical protein B1H10_00210 [candidate division KSB1 bacterium 4484_188]HFE64792.1 bifunctional metallophosphatase/5'-nucleotidase [Caldithrix sp.]